MIIKEEGGPVWDFKRGREAPLENQGASSSAIYSCSGRVTSSEKPES